MGTRIWLIVKDYYGKGQDLKSELLTFSWKESQGTQYGGNYNEPRIERVHDVSVIRRADNATVKLWSDIASQRRFEKVIVLFEREVGGSYRQFALWELSGVIITDMRTSGSYGVDPPPTETLDLSFAKSEYNQTAANDGAQGKPAGAQ